MLHGVTGFNLHNIIWCYTMLKGATRCCMVFLGCYTVLHGFFRVLHGVDGYYTVVHGVTRCYKVNETQKHTKQIEIHQSQITNHCLSTYREIHRYVDLYVDEWISRFVNLWISGSQGL